MIAIIVRESGWVGVVGEGRLLSFPEKTTAAEKEEKKGPDGKPVAPAALVDAVQIVGIWGRDDDEWLRQLGFYTVVVTSTHLRSLTMHTIMISHYMHACVNDRHPKWS